MKFIMFTLALFIFSIALYSNPTMPVVFSEIWFTDNGHLMLELCPHYLDFSPENIFISDGTTLSPWPADITFPATNVCMYFDVSEACPSLSFNPAGDTISLLSSHPYWPTSQYTIETYKWGSAGYNSPPLGANQSYVQIYGSGNQGVWSGWVQEAPPTPGSYPNEPLARDTLRIIVQNQNGYPISNLPIYRYPHTTSFLHGYTDDNGIYADTLYAQYYYFVVRNPENEEIVFQHGYYLEPNATTTIPITITMTGNSDNTVPVITHKGLQAYPVPYNRQKTEAITFRYDGDIKLVRKNYIRLYDTKGRFIDQIDLPAKGLTTWQPPSEISSGQYIAQLISNNRILDTKSFSIIK